MPNLLKIVTYPNKILDKPTKPVTEITDKIKSLVQDMFHTMEQNSGVGLAANQVGIDLQIAVINIEDLEEEHYIGPMPLVLINPKIIWYSEEIKEYEEGCLSFPNIKALISRPSRVKVTFKDLNNEEQTITAGGLLATCLQHEIDHLNGIIFLSNLSKLKKEFLIKKYLKDLKSS